MTPRGHHHHSPALLTKNLLTSKHILTKQQVQLLQWKKKLVLEITNINFETEWFKHIPVDRPNGKLLRLVRSRLYLLACLSHSCMTKIYKTWKNDTSRRERERERDGYTKFMLYRLEMGGEILKAWGSNKAYWARPGIIIALVNKDCCCCWLQIIWE